MPSNMSHAKALRVIGQLLEAANVETFELEKHGQRYLVWSASLTKAGELILRNALQDNDFASQNNRQVIPNVFCFNPADISRLDARAQKRRGNQPSSAMQPPIILPHQLRSLGDHLDRIEVSAFHIMWTAGSVILGYQPVDGEWNYRTFTAEELRQRGLHRKLLRSTRYLLPRLDT
jgi:hypothetical protein